MTWNEAGAPLPACRVSSPMCVGTAEQAGLTQPARVGKLSRQLFREKEVELLLLVVVSL